MRLLFLAAQPAVEVVAFEADQRFLFAFDQSKYLAGAFHCRHGEQCGRFETGILRGLLDSPVAVSTRGGELSIAWAGGTSPVLLTGPAVSVFEGSIDI